MQIYTPIYVLVPSRSNVAFRYAGQPELYADVSAHFL